VTRQPLWRRPLPYYNGNITFILIGINLFVFFLGTINRDIVSYLAMNPALTVVEGFIWQPFTYMFAHSGISHLVFNMLGLFFFGTQVEHQLGSWEFLLFYLLTGFLAGVFSLGVYWFTGSYYVFLLGASGAVFAVLLAFATFFPDAEIYIFGIIPVRAAILVIGYTAIELFSQMSGRGGNVAHLTHLAGFGFAYLYFVIRVGISPYRRFFDDPRRWLARRSARRSRCGSFRPRHGANPDSP
jgi:membrane associated rhomboid family serine protease